MFSSKKIFEELLATEPKIKHDEASFAMLNMESSIQNTKFEGAAISVTIDYYRSLLLYSNDLVKSPLSSKALDVALKAVDGLLYFYDRIHTTQLPPIDSLISDIKYRCQTSRTCYFPSGWAGSKYGHFAGIKFRVLPDGRYACAIINRGAGMQYHSALKQVGQNKELDYQSHEFAIDLNSSHGQDFLLRVIYLQTDRRAYDQQTIEVATIIKLPSNHNTIKPYSEEDLYGLLEFYGEAISSNKPVLERALPPQVTGTCSITSVEAVVRDALLTLDGITLKDIKLLNFIIRQRSIIEAFKAYRAESSQHAVLEWAVREYYVQISNHAPEILTDEEVIISTQLADHISQILVFDHSQHVNELCARKALPPLEGKWFTKLSDSTPIVIKNEQCITPEKLNIDKRLDSSGCKASDVISYLDQAITYFESETSTMALMELRGFAHSLAITSGAHHDLYWNTLSNEQAVLVVSKLSQIVKFLGNLGSNNHDVTNAPYKFEIALIAYDIAAQLATQIQSLQLNNQYALTLDDVFTHQTFFHDATSYHTTKYISANFKQRESGKQTIFGNSINYHPKDATQDYILNVLLTSEKKQLAIMMLKEKSCLASDEIDVNEKILFKILMTRECNGERKSAFETELVLGETLTNLINLSGTAHSLGIYKSEYSKDGDPDLARPILHFTPTKFHMELTLHDDILRSSDSNAKTKALYELKKHFPPIPRIKDEMLHLDFAENTIYHPHDDLLAKRTLVAKENHNNHLLPYGIKLSGTLRNEESAWETHSNNEQLLEELDEDLRAIGCSPTLQIMNTLEWAQFNIDKLTVEPVRDRLFTLLFEYGRMDTTLANNMNNTVSLIDTFLASAFNTYQFNPDQYLISDNHEAFLWLCRLQHAFRQHLEITSSSYSLKIPQILWPDVKQILTPLLDVKMNRDKRYCLARIIISTYQNLHNLSGNDIQNILTCKLILQINHPKSSGLYSMRFINELDYTVETVWLQHREQINLALSKYTPAKLTATINKVLSQALSKNINNEWRLIGNELQSFDETFVVKLHHGQLIKEKQIVINHEHLLRNSLIYSQLGLREKQLTLFNNGYRTKEGKRTEENTIYLSVISADREWEFYYYPAMNKIYAAFRNVIIAGTSHRFHFLFGNEDSPTPEKYFETHKLSNPLAAFNTKLVYQYWEAVDEESLLFIYDPSQSESAYLYSQDQGWLYLAKQGDTWHYSGQVLLNFNQPRTELEQAWADKLQPMLDLSKIKVEGLLQKNICKIQAITFTALKLSFHTQNNQLECNEYPGYYLSEQRSIEQLNGLPTVIVLENNKGLQKIIVPAFTLKSGHGNLAFERSNITSTQGLSDDANYYLYETDRDGELQGSSIEADLYLSVIYRSQGDYSRAMFYLLRTTHHYNNAQELVQISELLTTRQDQTPLGAAFDCKVACRMLQHTTKWAKKGDTWLHNVVLPSLIKHSLIQYQYYIKTANNHREDINIIPAYLRLSKDDIVCLDQLQDIYKTYLIKKQHIGWQDSYKEISILQQSDFDNHFTTERLEKIQTMPHLENKWRFSIDTIVDDMEFDDARHRRHTAKRQTSLRVYYDATDIELNQRRQEYGSHPSDHPGLDYLKSHFVDFFADAISTDFSVIKKFKYDLFRILQNDAKTNQQHVHLITTLIFVLNHPGKFRDSPMFYTSRECFYWLTSRCHTLLLNGFVNKCELLDNYATHTAVNQYQPLPNPYIKPSKLEFNITTAILPQQWKQPLAEYTSKYFITNPTTISNSHFPLDETSIVNITALEVKLLNRYRNGHEINLVQEKQVYKFNHHYSLLNLTETLQQRNKNNTNKLKELEKDIHNTLLYTPKDKVNATLPDRREAYQLMALYGGEQIIKPRISDLISVLLHHDTKQLAKKNHFISQQQLNTLLNKMIEFLLVQSENDQINDSLNIIGDKHSIDEFKYYQLQSLASTLDKQRNYDIRKYPEFLIYEYTTKRMLRSAQANAITTLIEHIESGLLKSYEYQHALLQFAAGGGKTAVMIPIFAKRFARLGLLPVIVNTNELYSIGVQEIPNSLKLSFQQNMEVIEREIEHAWNIDELTQLLRDLQLWRQQHKCVLIKATTWYSIHTAKKIAYVNGEEKLAISAQQILHFFENNAIRLEDEGHLISNPLQESIKTYGSMQTIPTEDQELFLAIYDCLMGRVIDCDEAASLAGIAEKSKLSVDRTSLRVIQEQLTRHILTQEIFSKLDRNSLSQYLLQEDRTRPTWLVQLNKLDAGTSDSIVLARAFIQMHLPHILNLQYKKDYGTSIHSNDLTAAPKHDAKDVTSHFSDQMLVMALTIQLYQQQGTPTNYVQRIIKSLQSEHIQERKWSRSVTKAECFLNTLYNNSSKKHTLDGITDAELMSYSHDPQIATHPLMIKRFLTTYALPQIRTPQFRVVSTPADLHAGFKCSIIFTATPGLRETYPAYLRDSDCYFDQAFEAQVIDTLLNTHNEQACLIDMAHTPTQFFTELQSNCPRLFNEMTALIDRGALLTSSTSKLVIEALIDSVEATNPKANALYLDEQHMHIRSVTHKHLNFAITGTRITEALQRYGIQLEDLPLFLFLDLSRTTGTDVKRPYRDRAGLTVGKEQTVTEIIQAAMRERQLLLDDAQSIIWVLFKSLYQQINSTNEQFDPKQLFYWMLRNEAKQIENKVIMRAYQGIYQLIEGIIWKRIHNKQVPYSDYSERLEQFVNLSPYHRYEQESILYKPQIVLRAYIYMLCDSFSIPIGHLPSSISRLLNQIINDTSQLVGNLRSTDNTALNEEVYQEQQSEIEQQQEIIEEQKIKSLFDQHSNFKFAIEYYDTSDQLDNIFSNKKDPASCYQDLKFSRCQALKTPKLLLCKKHFMPLAGNYKSYEITQLKPIRMLLVYFHTNAEYEFLAISAAGSEFFVNEINRLNTASPHHTYAIIGLGASILYASKSLTQEQRTTLPESFQLRQMVTFIGLLNGHINNPPILMQIAQQYQWNTKKYHCLVDEISRIHVSRHPIDLKSMLNFNKKDEYSYKPTAISRGFTTLILTPTMKVTNRTSNFRYLSKPESILPGSILGNTPVPYVSKEFHDAAHVECEFDQNHISFEDTAVCDAHKPQTSSTSRLTTPFAALVQLTSWFRNTVTSFAQLEAQESIDPHIQSDHPSTKNKDFVRSALSPALISTEQSCDKAPQPFQVCTPTMYGNENDGYIPTLTCSGPSYQTVVFPKTSNSNAVSSYTEGSSTISGDIYNPQSCRPIEFHGRPSVYCEGEQTTFVYTPEFSQRPLENLGANIMLGAVAIHMAYSSYQWIKDKFLGVDDSQLNEIEYIVNKEYFYLQVCKIQTALQKAEAQLNKLQTVMHPKNCEWATFSIEEFRYDLDNLINKFKKGRITQEELNECNDDVLYLLQEIKLEVKCCQQLPAGLYYQGVPWDAIALHEGVSQQRPRRQVAECLEHETDISATQKNRDHRTRINYSNTKLCFTESYLSHKQRTNYAIFTATSSTCPVEHNLTSDVTKYTKTIRTITQFI